MKGCNHKIELREQLIRIIKRAVLPDVDFGARENTDIGEPEVKRAAFIGMFYEIFIGKTSRHAQGLGMIGDRKVLVTTLPRSFHHFFSGVLSVGPSRMHVKIAADVLKLDNVG